MMHFQHLLCLYPGSSGWGEDNKREATRSMGWGHGEVCREFSILRRIFNRMVWFPFTRWIPVSFGSKIFSGTNRHTKGISQHSKTYRALELMYTYGGFSWGGNDFHFREAIWAHFWETFVVNAHALRNRLKLVRRKIREAIKERGKLEGEVKILSLASGSARAVLEVIAEMEKHFKLKAHLVDASRDAIVYSRGLAQELGVSSAIDWVRADVRRNKAFYEWEADIVEMVGLLDYLEGNSAVRLLKEIYGSLREGGILIVGNVIDNPERRFVREVVGWGDMVYRQPEDLQEILATSGFSRAKCHIEVEPLGIHAVAVAKK